MGVIYKITSPSGKVYVGKTYDLRKRINAHKCATRKGSNIILYNSIRKYGWDSHSLEVIEEVDDILLNEREIFWINELKTYCYENPNGLNMTKGGDGQRSTWMHKTELRKYFSNKFSGKGNPFYGKKHSKKTIDELSRKTREYNIKNNKKIPEWGVEKGRLKVIKPVIMYDKNGMFVKEFKSYTEAGKYVGIKASHVWESVTGRKSQAIGFHFRSKTNNYPKTIDVSKVKNKTIKRAVLTLTPDFEVLCEHDCAQSASNFWGIPKTTINRAAMYNWLWPIRTGHIFIYSDLYAEIKKLTA